MVKITRTKAVFMLFVVSSLAVLGLTVYTSVIMRSISVYTYKDIESRMLAVSRYCAKIAAAGELEMLTGADDVEKPLYSRLKRRLANFADENGVVYAYYMRSAGDGMVRFIVDNDYTEDAVGLETEPLTAEEGVISALRGRAFVTSLESYSSGYSGLISAYAPVYNDRGMIIAVAGVDIGDEQVIAIRDQVNAFSSLLMAAVAVVLVCGALNVYLAEKTDKARLAALDKALSASRAKGSFLSNMSHEMRTPMNAIIGMTQLAKAAESGDRKDYCLGRIEEASTHLLGVINDVLDMSKIEAGKLELSPVHFKFSDILEKVKTINDYRMEQKHQTFEMDIDENIPPELIGDDQRLNQIIMNLMSNAVKFTPEGGVVRLKAALESLNGDEARLTFSVKDSGIGISEEQKARLFNSFEQADSSTSRRYGGTGLGLAISQKIVELMDGEIRVESEPGKGAEFIFTVSLTADSVTPEEAETSGDGGDVSFAGLKILLAEDLDINREIAGALIEPAGAEVFFAADGSEAVDMFAADPAKYDLIFMDVQMPEMDGYEATRAIRALSFPQAKTVPIIAMTANVFKEDIDKCLECGMNGHVGKPLDSKDVYEKIAKHCG